MSPGRRCSPVQSGSVSGQRDQQGARQLVRRLSALATYQKLLTHVMDYLQLPLSVFRFLSYPTTYDRSNTIAAFGGVPISNPPPFDGYLDVLWRYWREQLDPTTAFYQ